jgi:hypothetical protein
MHQYAGRLEAMEKSFQDLTAELMERDRDVDRDMITLEQRINRHRTAIDRTDDHVGLLPYCGNRGLTIPNLVSRVESGGGSTAGSNRGHAQLLGRLRREVGRRGKPIGGDWRNLN